MARSVISLSLMASMTESLTVSERSGDPQVPTSPNLPHHPSKNTSLLRNLAAITWKTMERRRRVRRAYRKRSWRGCDCFPLGKQSNSPTHQSDGSDKRTRQDGTKRKPLPTPMRPPRKGDRARPPFSKLELWSTHLHRVSLAVAPDRLPLTSHSVFVRWRAGRLQLDWLQPRSRTSRRSDETRFQGHHRTSTTEPRIVNVRYPQTCAKPMQKICVCFSFRRSRHNNQAEGKIWPPSEPSSDHLPTVGHECFPSFAIVRFHLWNLPGEEFIYHDLHNFKLLPGLRSWIVSSRDSNKLPRSEKIHRDGGCMFRTPTSDM